jgi:hypothetical protein
MSTLGLILLVSFVLAALATAALICCIRQNTIQLVHQAVPGLGAEGETRYRGSNADKLSLEAYYRPMRHLLDPDELACARALEGVSQLQWKEFRGQRIRAFRSYLSDLKTDFRRLEFKLRYLILAGSAGDADLVHSLNRLRAKFGLGMLMLEIRLLAFQMGVGSISIASLLDEIEELERALQPEQAQSATA